MHGWSHKSITKTKTYKNPNNPSFSSTLLDEIYSSIDYAGGDKLISSKQNVSGSARRSVASSAVEDERIATIRGAFLVQKWMDMKINTKNFTHRRKASSVTDNHPFFFNNNNNNNSISRSPKPSCFRPFRPNLIKTEQPISPGRRITSFLNSLFTNVHLKKPKDSKTVKMERTSHDHQSTCSSASSYTRSCLSKNSSRSREKINNGVRRTVRFYPVSVIIDEDCRPCGEKFICGEPDIMKVNVTAMCGNRFDDDDDNDDIGSDISSDLFELDHLSIMNECDELPVYGTTHFGTNCDIANGMICI